MITFALAFRAADLAVRRTATGLVEVLASRPADITALASGIGSTLRRALHAGTRPHAGDHAAQALDGLFGQFVPQLREGVDAGDGCVGFEFGGFHDLLADEALVGLVRQRGLGDLAAQAHHLLPAALVGLEETTQRSALVFVQVAEQLLRVEGRVGLPTLVLVRASFSARVVLGTGFLASDAIAGFAARILAGLELAARRALAVGGAFFTGALLGAAGIGQGREGKPAERCEQRAGEVGQFHRFFWCARRWCGRPASLVQRASRQKVRGSSEERDAAAGGVLQGS